MLCVLLLPPPHLSIPQVLTLKLDTKYWPSWELRRDPDTATWQRHLINHGSTEQQQHTGLAAAGLAGATGGAASAAAAAVTGAAPTGAGSAAASASAPTAMDVSV